MEAKGLQHETKAKATNTGDRNRFNKERPLLGLASNCVITLAGEEAQLIEKNARNAD